jgi:4-oxalocrotonate tautomerase
VLTAHARIIVRLKESIKFERIKKGGKDMPFVTIRIYEGHSKERKSEIMKRVTNAIHEVAQVPKEYIWVVFEDIPKSEWAIGGKFGDEE